MDSVSISRTTTVSLHDPTASDVRRRIQQYFHQRLPSLLQEHSWDYQLPVHGFILGLVASAFYIVVEPLTAQVVTSVRSLRTSNLTHNHDEKLEDLKNCLKCMIEALPRVPHAETSEKPPTIAIRFHAFLESVGTIDHDRWGIWTLWHRDADGSEREFRLESSHTYE
jgi:hypothetical protein